MLKKMMKVMVATIMVMVCATTVSAEENPMEAAKQVVLDEINEFADEINNEIKEKGLDVNNYKCEVGSVVERYGGYEIEGEYRLIISGDVYTFVYSGLYDFDEEEYDTSTYAIYSERDNGWFSIYDKDFEQTITDRYPEMNY